MMMILILRKRPPLINNKSLCYYISFLDIQLLLPHFKKTVSIF
eukprot:UN00937